MLKKLYHWTLEQAKGPHAEKALAAISFAESSFFPIPPDVLLAPMVMTQPERAYRLALICTIGSVLGGLFGYLIGYFLEDLGLWILTVTGHKDGLAHFRHWFDQWGVWVILIKGFTPIPYKLTTIASGLAHFNLTVFIIASVITRGARFFAVAFLFKKFGAEMAAIIEKRFYLVSAVVLGLLVIGFIALKFLPK